MEQNPKRTRNISFFLPNPPNSFLSSTTYHSYRPDPMFKYMKSPLSQRTRTMLEEVFIPSKILNLTNKSTKYYPTDIYKQPIKIMKIEYKLNTSRTKNHKHATDKSQAHPIRLPAHLKANSLRLFPTSTSKSQCKPVFPLQTHKHLSYQTHCLSERNIKPKHIHNQTYSHCAKRHNHNHISKSPIKQLLPLSLLNKANSEQTLFRSSKHNKSLSFRQHLSFINEHNTSASIIDDYSCKTFNSSKPKAVHFALTNIFHIPSFAVFGICHGSGPSAFVVATTASHYFTFAFTNEYTYYSSGNSDISSDVIEQMFTDNDYKLIYSIGKEVDIAVSKSLPVSNKYNYSLSYGIAIVIRNNVIHVSRGSKIENVTLIEDIVGEVEMINSKKHCKGKRQKETDILYEHVRYNSNMKYIILCSAKIVNSFCWKNILKIICDAYKNGKTAEYKEKSLLSLTNKIEKIYKYITRIYGVNANGNGNNNNNINHVNCFSLLLAKCVG